MNPSLKTRSRVSALAHGWPSNRRHIYKMRDRGPPFLAKPMDNT